MTPSLWLLVVLVAGTVQSAVPVADDAVCRRAAQALVAEYTVTAECVDLYRRAAVESYSSEAGAPQ